MLNLHKLHNIAFMNRPYFVSVQKFDMAASLCSSTMRFSRSKGRRVRDTNLNISGVQFSIYGISFIQIIAFCANQPSVCV